MLRKEAEARMVKLRAVAEGRAQEPPRTGRKRELGLRIVRAFEDVWGIVQADIRDDVVFDHKVERILLPSRQITEIEFKQARRNCEQLRARAKSAKTESEKTRLSKLAKWHEKVVSLYNEQKKGAKTHEIEVHVLRIGDLAIATNPFELFQDYAMRIHGRSAAEQTMLVQLASPFGKTDKYDGYLPSERAVKGGGYSAVPQSTPVGPEGGQMLVEKTVELIDGMFKK